MNYRAELLTIDSNYAIKSIKHIRNKRGQLLSMVSLIPLTACGGGASPAPTTPQAPPPPPEPDYTESPTGTFTGRDNANLTLAQGTATTDLTVNSKDGNDTITTGSGNDVINGAGGNDTIAAGDGNDIIRANTGADTVDAGAGDDIIVVVGTTGASDYTETSITNPAGSGLNISSILSLAELNGHATSDVEAGETIDGGTGADSLLIYGTVDLTGVTIANVTTVYVNSSVIFNINQLNGSGGDITTITGDGYSTIKFATASQSLQQINLSDLTVENINTLELGENISLSIANVDSLASIGISTISGAGTLMISEQNPVLDNIAISNTINLVDAQGITLADLSGFLIVNPDQILSGGGIQVEGNETNQALSGTQGDDKFIAGTGFETINTSDGQDIIIGNMTTLAGDTILGFSYEDTIQINGLQSYGLTTEDFILNGGTLTLTQNAIDRTGINGFSINVSGISDTVNLVVESSSTQSITFTINIPPSFNHSETIVFDTPPGSFNNLTLPIPTDGDGDALIITIVTLPHHTQIQHAGGSIVSVGDTITLDEYKNLTFITTDNYTGETGSLHLQVSDGAGGQDDLFVDFISNLTPSQTLSFQEVTPLPDTITGEMPPEGNNVSFLISENEVFSNPEGIIDVHRASTINNAGVLWTDGNSSSWNYTIEVNYLNDFINSGDIINYGGSGGVWLSGWVGFNNSGLIHSSASHSTAGIRFGSIDGGFTNSGVIQVSSTAGTAIGVSPYNTPTSEVVNSGSLLVQGFTGAIGFNFNGLPEGSGVFINSGTIIAESTNTNVESIAVKYGIHTSYFNTIENTGFISADIAFQTSQIISPHQVSSRIINNSGEIWGDFLLNLGGETINNNGVIVGDVFFGEGDDIYNGSNGDFSGEIHGEAGDDTLTGGRFNETFYGGFGNDIIDGGQGPDMLFGGANNDTLIGGVGNDYISGASGDDTILQKEGDVILAGSGDDTITITDLGFESIDGGTGINTLIISDNLKADLSFTAENNSLLNIDIFYLNTGAAVALNSATLSAGQTYRVSGTTNNETILLGTGWIKGSTINIDGEQYDIYTNGDITINIQSAISTTINISAASGYSSKEIFNDSRPAPTPRDITDHDIITLSEGIMLWDNILIDTDLTLNTLYIYTGYSHDIWADSFIIENHGTINVTSSYRWDGIRGGNTAIDVQNYGNITLEQDGSLGSSTILLTSFIITNHESAVISSSITQGDNTAILGGPLENYGLISSITGNGLAIGVDISTFTATLNNTGTIFASGTQSSAISTLWSSVIINDGNISAEGTENSTALFYLEPWDGNITWSVVNTGIISGSNAIYAELSTTPYDSLGTLDLINSGIINGAFTLLDGDDQITNTGEIYGDITLDSGADSFSGANGTFIGVINGGADNDTISTGLGNATINGGTGNDSLSGGLGADVFVFDSTFGNDTITDFEDTVDLLDFSSSTLTFADLTITQNGDDTLIEDADGNSITLSGITSTDITADDFIF